MVARKRKLTAIRPGEAVLVLEDEGSYVVDTMVDSSMEAHHVMTKVLGKVTGQSCYPATPALLLKLRAGGCIREEYHEAG
jgi:hypothetical protein